MQTLGPPASLPLDGSRLGQVRFGSFGSSVLVRLSKDEVLVGQGDDVRAWHLVHSGAIALSSTQPDGRRTVLAVLGPGDLWPPRLASGRGGSHQTSLEARALIPSTVQVIPAPVLDHLIRLDRTTALWVCSALRRNAERFQDALTGTLGLQVRERVWRVLVDLARIHGRSTSDGVQLCLPLGQETLASIVGATRESVNRALRSLEQKGTVRRCHGRYVLPIDAADQALEIESP